MLSTIIHNELSWQLVVSELLSDWPLAVSFWPITRKNNRQEEKWNQFFPSFNEDRKMEEYKDLELVGLTSYFNVLAEKRLSRSTFP